MSTTEGFCKKALKRDANKVIQCWTRNDEQEEESKKDKERKKSIMKERDKLRNWDPRLEESDESSGYGRHQSGCELAEWKVENKQSKIQSRRAKDAESVGQNRHTTNG